VGEDFDIAQNCGLRVEDLEDRSINLEASADIHKYA
jgi:hypothetical protein